MCALLEGLQNNARIILFWLITLVYPTDSACIINLDLDPLCCIMGLGVLKKKFNYFTRGMIVIKKSL